MPCWSAALKFSDQSTTNFGLLNRPYETDDAYDPERKRTQWERFQHHVSQLKSQCEPGIQYKVLYLARHGQGHHNVAEGFYGTPEWNVSTFMTRQEMLKLLVTLKLGG